MSTNNGYNQWEFDETFDVNQRVSVDRKVGLLFDLYFCLYFSESGQSYLWMSSRNETKEWNKEYRNVCTIVMMY